MCVYYQRRATSVHVRVANEERETEKRQDQNSKHIINFTIFSFDNDKRGCYNTALYFSTADRMCATQFINIDTLGNRVTERVT